MSIFFNESCDLVEVSSERTIVLHVHDKLKLNLKSAATLLTSLMNIYALHHRCNSVLISVLCVRTSRNRKEREEENKNRTDGNRT